MDKHLENQLVARYPEVFRDVGGDPAQTCMADGLAVGNGWFNLIDVLCANFVARLRQEQAYLQRLAENLGRPVRHGHPELIDDHVIAEQRQRMEQALAEVPVAAQVKEKFGGLRFYVDNATPAHDQLIRFAEMMASRTCEDCGAPGQAYPFGWVRTLCPVHAEQAHGAKAAEYLARQQSTPTA